MMRSKILAIEAAIGGGSVALLSGDAVLQSWHSTEAPARSEELLARISDIIGAAGIEREELTGIAVSNGPGSYTGIRIGLATAIGLGRSLGVPCVGVSALRAISIASGGPSRRNQVLVPIGRDGYCWQTFENGVQTGLARTGNLDTFASEIRIEPDSIIYAHGEVYPLLAGIESIRDHVVDAGRDIAVSIGLASVSIDDGLQPFYARDIPILPAGEKV
ncbi:MAG: tRNA (adenosine(37)-N6)-threonylcarbamoyltransferase complex dimerization subunit type 1 TsaB [Acidobacteria bacterium]|nr:tRNA (adenosine(37)-N6)-threonylcarbamoyltransferase complex dimerization subunit type 1 TsaB [Acidobacteriota bacterium]